jgi:poly-gamma-glutamate synthesis protein (capsule biosynthesis protein)
MPIDDALAARMAPSWRPGCPVPLQDLRYLRIGHWDFDGVDRLGEMVVHEDAVATVEAAFRRLHEIRFPIRSMRLVDDFGADDDASMAADNTSAFNCRPVAGTSTWSQHSYGRAVDVNPLENPYVTGNGTFPPSGAAFAVRSGAQGQFMAGGDEVRAFTDRGWGWGGVWAGSKDYQHFSASGR